MKLATVFSGIGAIEQALHRMGIDYEIVFACDNGDVELNLLEGKELNDYTKLKTAVCRTHCLRSSLSI